MPGGSGLSAAGFCPAVPVGVGAGLRCVRVPVVVCGPWCRDVVVACLVRRGAAAGRGGHHAAPGLGCCRGRLHAAAVGLLQRAAPPRGPLRDGDRAAGPRRRACGLGGQSRQGCLCGRAGLCCDRGGADGASRQFGGLKEPRAMNATAFGFPYLSYTRIFGHSKASVERFALAASSSPSFAQ